MCGICGIVSFNENYRVKDSLLAEMRDSMIHRGPDGKGIWVSEDKYTGLAHRRLSIIDLSESATQPMSNESNDIYLVFNGEIYNHLEIRNLLNKTGNHKWKTDHSDTEVIIHAYEEWGLDFIGKLRGQFAIAIWDGRIKELYLIRDRAGIKPLYYCYTNKRLLFASEIKAIIKDESIERKVNEEAFFHYLTFLVAPAPLTLFNGIYKIPAGCFLKFSESGTPSITTYYDLLDNLKPVYEQDENEIIQRLYEELMDAVKSHKMSDVPVGIFLSGGIDSSTNAALFSKGESEQVKTFTIGYDKSYESYVNETQYAKFMADWIHADYFEKLLSIDDLVTFLPRMIYLQDEPIADPVCIPLYYVSKLAKENGVTVCQVGEGSDELFHGYNSWWKISDFNRILNKFPLISKKVLYALFSLTKYNDSDHNEFIRRSARQQPIFWSGAEFASNSKKFKLLSDRLKGQFSGFSSWEAIRPYYENYINKTPENNHSDWMTYIDLKLRLPELLLMRVDKMSMGTSIETRVPFLDHKFIEFALSIPPRIRLKNAEPKYLLKKTVRGIIPDAIIDRKKQGFGIPLQDWLHDKLDKRILSEVNSFLDNTDFFNKAEVIEIIRKRDSYSWSIYNFALWYNMFVG